MTPRLLSHLIFLSLLATVPLIAMNDNNAPQEGAVPEGTNAPQDTTTPRGSKRGERTREHFKQQDLAILGLKERVDKTDQNVLDILEEMAKVQKIESEHLDTQDKAISDLRSDMILSTGNIRTEIDDTKKEIAASSDATAGLFGQLEQTSREGIAALKEELTKCSDERFVKLEDAAKNSSEALALTKQELTDYADTIAEKAGESIAGVRQDIMKLEKNIRALDEKWAANPAGNGNAGAQVANNDIASLRDDIAAIKMKLATLGADVTILAAQVGGGDPDSTDGSDDDSDSDDEFTNALDRITDLELRLTALDAKMNPAPFEAQLREFCINNAKSINNPVSALLPLGIYQALNGSEWIEKLVGSTTDPKPIAGLIQRALFANIVNALLPKTGAVSNAKNGWVYLGTYLIADLAVDLSYPLVSGYVPERVTSNYEQLPEIVQTGLPWLGKSLLAFAVAPAA
jgi:hypothetical protein